jgi:hypothetical protein
MLIMAKNLLDACKNCVCVTFVFDGPASAVKRAEIDQRYEKAHSAGEFLDKFLATF